MLSKFGKDAAERCISMKPFVPFFRAVIRSGALTVIDADGMRHVFGDGVGPSAAMRLTDRRLHRRLAFRPSLALGEGYMEGTLAPAEGSRLIDLLTLLMANESAASRAGAYGWLCRAASRIGRWAAANSPARSRHNVAHHYDLKGELFGLFLDADRQYSCAYFEEPALDIDEAQRRKKRLIMRKLLLSPGQRVLDIGSGWGGLGLSIARDAGADVTGITLSDEQLAFSNARARAEGLASRCRFVLQDYRHETGRYQRIVSVGMLEHVGLRNYDAFFRKVASCLADDGVAVIHSIGAFDRPGPIPAWVAKYIFPGAYVPTLSEIAGPVERAGLKVTDIEIWRMHYAETLRHWRERFAAHRAAAAALYDERFCRMWEFYLAACETAFRIGDTMVFQLQLAKDQAAVPLTRNYLADVGSLPTAHTPLRATAA
jgi:cyclopropane-fatty-acyl-phospholipid synthase